MRRSMRVAVAIVAGAGGAVMPSVAAACSWGPFPTIRSEGLTFLIGTAVADTVRAGPGAVKYSVADGHLGPAGNRVIFGQVVSVERLTGFDGARLPANVPQVVLVPWDYGPDCTPTPLIQTARWVTPGLRGLFRGILRARSHWVNGVPTLDVFNPAREPYPSGPTESASRQDARPDSSLSIDELFPLLKLLPDSRRLGNAEERAVEPLMNWARANPELARRPPMADVVATANAIVREARVRRVKSPVVGTYRFVVFIPGDSDRVFFARTEANPATEWQVNRTGSQPGDPTVIPPMEGYFVLAVPMPSLAALPRGCGARQSDRAAYLALVSDPPITGPDGLEWRGMIEFDLIAGAFPGDSAVAAYSGAWQERYRRRFKERLPEETPARFTLNTGEPMRVRLDFTLDDGRQLVIRGERISLDAAECLPR